MQGRRAEIRNELNLPLGVARSRRHRQHAETFGSVLEAQSARKHAVPRRVLKDIAPPQADHVQATRHGIGPLVQILLRVQDDRRGARRATGGMQAHHFAHRHRGKPERVIVAQILFRSKRNLTQVVQRTYVFRRQMSLGKPFLIKEISYNDGPYGANARIATPRFPSASKFLILHANTFPFVF